MIYISRDDLTTDSYDRFIKESSDDIEGTLEKAEKRAIGLAKTYLSGRYKVDLIFGDPPVRNELLVDIICQIVLEKVFGRNAARKVSSDIKTGYDFAIEQLEKINSGRTVLADLPMITDESGQALSDSLFGNLSNPNFYI
ncbi:hypothetical protein KO02_16370 [Sphingobacterium sp. ML3W]|uniref:phage protein Gp36 family protein n=1 Tax=Sphingobacterium sp. ML3W TaxID=1538644 RepID=UPI0004F82563|nr:phage protein Gp36 family protein [Sphingobacterium sp. ML3W]AIM38083.1 hypothetical protein KO02_16370 [Sphingobacterium sp. ML3W]